MVLALFKTDRNAVRGLQQFIGQSPWSTEPLLVNHRTRVAAALGEPTGVVIVDGSGFPKDGPESVGAVARSQFVFLGLLEIQLQGKLHNSGITCADDLPKTARLPGKTD